MNKQHTWMTAAIVSVIFPLSAIAQTHVNVPPMYVRPIQMSDEEIKAKETAIKDLMDETANLAAQVEAKRNAVADKLQVVKDPEQFNQLKNTLQNYQTRMDECQRLLALRDQMLADRDAQIAQLRESLRQLSMAPIIVNPPAERKPDVAVAQLPKSEYFAPIVVNAPQAPVQQAPASIVVNPPVQLPTISSSSAPEKEHTSLAAIQYLLEQKSDQLSTLKDTLAKTKEELAQANVRYNSMIQDYESRLKNLDTSKEENRKMIADLVEKVRVSDENLKKSVENQNAHLQQLEASLKEKDDQLAKFDTMVAEKDKEIADLKAQLAQAKEELGQTKQELNQTKEELAGLKTTLGKDDDAFAAIRKNGTILRSQLTEAQNKARSLQQLSDVQRRHIAMLAEKNRLLSDKLANTVNAWHTQDGKYEEEIARLRRAIDESEKQIANLDNVIKTKQQTKQHVHDLLDNYKNQVKDTTTLNALQAKNIESYRTRLGQIETDLRTAQEQSQAKQADLDAMRQKLAKADSQIKEAATRVENVKQGYEAEIARLRQAIDEAEKQIANLDNVIKTKQETKQHANHDMSGVLENYKRQVEDTTVLNEAQAKNIALYKAKVEQIRQQLDEANAQIKALTIAAQNGTEDQSQAKLAELESLRQELEKAKSQIEKANAQVKEVQQESGAKDLSLSMVQSLLQEKSKAHDAEVAQFKEQIKTRGDELAALREQLTVAEAKLKEAQQNDQLARVQEMLKSSREEIAQLNILLKQKEEQITGLQNNLDVNSKEFTGQNKALENLKTELEKQQASVGKLKNDLQWKEKEITRMNLQTKGQIAPLTEQLRLTEKKLQEALERNDVTKINQALAQAKDQIENLKRSLQDKEDELKEAQSVSSQKDSRLRDLTRQSTALKTRVDELMEKITVLEKTPKKDEATRNKIDDLQQQLKERQTQVNSLQKEIKDLQNTLAEQTVQAKNKATELLAKITALQATGQTGEDYKEKMKSLQDELKERSRQVKQLENNLTDKDKILGARQKEIDALRADLKAAREELRRLVTRVRVIEKIKTFGSGNEGYLFRQGKDLSTMAYQVSEQIKTVEAKVEARVKESTDANEDYQTKYEAAAQELQDTKEMLRKCRSSLSLKSLFSLKKEAYAGDDLVPAK